MSTQFEATENQRRAALRDFFAELQRRTGEKLSPFCKRAKISDGTIRSYLKDGSTQTMTMETYDRLANAAGVPVTVLLGLEDWPDGETGRPSPEVLRLEMASQVGALTEAIAQAAQERHLHLTPKQLGKGVKILMKELAAGPGQAPDPKLVSIVLSSLVED